MNKIKKISRMAFVVCVIVSLTFGSSYFTVNAQEIETQSTCSHSWSGWQLSSTSYGPGPSFEDCKIRYTRWLRGCTKCGELEYKTTQYQMTHSWSTAANGDKVCNNCGRRIGTLRILETR